MGRRRGVFISFEGGEGCGKSTQIRRLIEHMKASGQEVLLTREPGGTAVGEQLRHVLQHSREAENMVPETELLLFAASRAQLVREVIAPALQANKLVISDRFLDSTTVYQGVARQISESAVAKINHFAVGTCLPDTTFLLDLDLKISQQRMSNRENPKNNYDRMEAQPPDFHEAVRQGYLKLAAKEPARFVVLDAKQEEEKIFTQLLGVLKKRHDGLFN
ncbi:MAG: dTMP kinase [Chthoniobacterales bacterium]